MTVTLELSKTGGIRVVVAVSRGDEGVVELSGGGIGELAVLDDEGKGSERGEGEGEKEKRVRAFARSGHGLSNGPHLRPHHSRPRPPPRSFTRRSRPPRRRWRPLRPRPPRRKSPPSPHPHRSPPTALVRRVLPPHRVLPHRLSSHRHRLVSKLCLTIVL